LILVHLQGPRKAKFDTQLCYVYAGQVKPGRKEIATASKTIHGIKSAWVKEQQLVVESGKVTLYPVDWNVTFGFDWQRGKESFGLLEVRKRVFCEAVEVVLSGSLTFAIVPQRSETPTKAQHTRSTLQNYLSPPFLGFQYGAVAFT
jgi:hypothetical protein